MNSGDIMKYDVVIIGAGASGMMCGSFLKRNKNNLKILILEKNDKVGKKLSMTGNGKCNLGNTDMSIKHFYSSGDLNNFKNAIESENYLETLKDIGILTTTENNRIYPYSMQAISVCKSFERYLTKNGVQIKYNYHVKNVEHKDNEYIINDEITSKAVVIATGGITYPKTGSTGDGYKILEKLNHTITETYPALTYLMTNYKYQKELHGVRVNATATLKVDNKTIKKESGQVQFTKNALSGICIFNLSRDIKKDLKENKNVNILLDLIPDYDKLDDYFRKFNSYKMQDVLSCVINNKLATVICKETNTYDKLLSSIDIKTYKNIMTKLKNMSFKIIDIGDETVSQVTSGGLSLDEVNESFESKNNKNLYVIGELLDVDGDSGGYNLSWAFNSAMVAAKDINSKLV